MELSKHNLNTLMLFLQQKIEENAEYISDELEKGSSTDFITYPPNGGLTEKENLSLNKLKNDPDLKAYAKMHSHLSSIQCDSEKINHQTQ